MNYYRLPMLIIFVFCMGGYVHSDETRVVTLPSNYPLFEKLARAEKATTPQNSPRVKAVSCRPPTLLGVSLSSASRELASPGPLSFVLDQKGYYVKDVLEFVRLTPSGKIALGDFMPRYQSGNIKIEQMTSFGESRCGRNPAACYIPDKQTIFVDKSVELGALGPVLMHEIVHSIDGDLQKMEAKLADLHRQLGLEMKSVINRTVARTKRDALALTEADFEAADIETLRRIKADSYLIEQVQQFRSERLAYDWGDRASREMLLLFPQYYQAHPLDSQKRSDNEIVDGYQFDRIVIGKYLSGACDETL